MNHYYLVVTVDTDGNRSGGGHELPRGIDDLLVQRTGPTSLTLSWGAITLDLNGRWNPAVSYEVYGQAVPFSRLQTPGLTPLMLTGVPSAPLPMPPDTVFFYSVIAVDARGSESPW